VGGSGGSHHVGFDVGSGASGGGGGGGGGRRRRKKKGPSSFIPGPRAKAYGGHQEVEVLDGHGGLGGGGRRRPNRRRCGQTFGGLQTS